MPLRDALILHEVLEDHAEDLEDALGLYCKATSRGAVGQVRDKRDRHAETGRGVRVL